MARTDNIPKDALENVARQISELVERGTETRLQVESPLPLEARDEGASEQEAPLKIWDSFSIWKFKPHAVEQIRESTATGDLSDWVVPCDLIFHLILLRNEFKAFARSRFPFESAGDRTLDQLNVSPLAELLARAVERVKENKEGDPLVDCDPVVRLLEVPAYHIIALWLFDETARESRVLIVLAPERSSLRLERFLTTEEFFTGLREQPLLEGIA